MKISVVIPVLNEEKYIAECLEAIQNNSMNALEILVVDGGSSDRTREIAREKGAVVLDNKKKNAASGRNIGIKAARGEIIAFTDGDCIPDKNWIEAIHTAFLDTSIDGIGGFISPAKPENEYEKFWGDLSLKQIMTFEEIDYFVSEKSLNQGFMTANCAYSKELLYKLNGFSDWFANNAEDIDLTWRAIEANAKLKYVAKVRVQAHSPTDLKGIRKKSFRNGYASSKLQKRYGKFLNYDMNIYKTLLKNLKLCFTKDRNAAFMVNELVWHLAGKYYGSIKVGIINI